MMSNLPEIYDTAFFAEWGKGNLPYTATAAVITDILIAEFQPRRIADVGCGCGVYSQAFADRGVEVVSLDGVAPPAEHAYPVTIQRQDLTVSFENVWGRFDFALCLEVAEHIPEELSGVFLDNLARFSDVIVLSAAPPFQGGHHHVNERPKRYWVERLAEIGVHYDRGRTGRIFQEFVRLRPPLMWMGQHVSVYRKPLGPTHPGLHLPFSIRGQSS